MKTTKKAALVMAAAGMAVGAAAGAASADSGASGAAVKSPGAVSGNDIQVPIDIPVNVVGNTIDVIGLLNPAFGNTGINH
ncbi:MULTISPECIES: chaplin [unclassified Streptomyces]|uniref:chaplin n=1 Tax=unclassified Streptomyces TaxID=2593676 RepID=UPI002DDAEA9E|nr:MULTISPECIES: chaplin [unclassified Streptomyces]